MVPLGDPLERRRLGATALSATALGLGTAPLGGMFEAVDDERAHDVIRRAWELGVRLFDSAPLYGHGESERRSGHVLGEMPRDEYVLATKVGRLLRADAPPDVSQVAPDGSYNWHGVPDRNPVFDFSRDGTLRSIEESLERLGLDRIDILHVHDPDDHYEQALTGACVALAELRSEGVIGAVGVGMNQAPMLARFVREADLDCILLAGRYTLLDHAGLDELLPLCLERGVAVIAGGIYNSGILAAPEPGARFDYAPAGVEWLERARRLAQVCARHETPLMAAAAQFPLAHPAVEAVLAGPRSTQELEQTERMLRVEVPPSLWQELLAEGLLPEAAPLPG